MILRAVGACRPRQSVNTRRASTPPTQEFGAEALEQRRLLAAIHWDGGGDGHSFTDARNWAADVLPGDQDDAWIDTRGITVDLTGSVALRSLHSQALLRVSGGGSITARGDLGFASGLMAERGSVLSSQGGAITMSGNTIPVLEVGGILRAARIELDAGSGVLLITGTLDASSQSGIGGKIDALGRRVVLEGAIVDASGSLGGGSIRIGGDYAGAPTVRSAEVTYVDPSTRILADARSSGSGGRVIVWSDTVTGFYGKVSARGGASGGNGGFVETSGKVALDATGEVDAQAPAGAAGTWLLDPRNVTISTAVQAGGAFSGGNPTTFTPTADNAVVNVNTIASALGGGTSVVITTGGTGVQAGTIVLASPLSILSQPGGSTLTLRATDSITLAAGITATTASPMTFNFFANDATLGGDGNPASGSVVFNAAVTISIGAGSLNFSGVNLTTGTVGTITAGSVDAGMSGDVQINGDMTGTTQINLRAGSDGTGNLSFGATGVDLATQSLSLQAGDGPGGGGAAANVNVNTNSPLFHATPGGANAPGSFTLRQDATVVDTTIPALARFGGPLFTTTMTIRSDEGDLTASTAANLNGAGLTLSAAGNATLNASLSGGTGLALIADNDGVGGGTAQINAAQNLSGFTIAGAVVNIPATSPVSSTNNAFIFSAGGIVTVAGNVNAIEGVIFIQGGTITLIGNLGTNNGIEINAGAGGVTQSTGSLTGARLLATSTGSVLLAGANDVTTVAGNATGNFTYNDINAVTVDLVTVSGSFAGVSSNGITTITAGALTINRTLNAELRVVLNTPSGASTSGLGIVTGPALLLQGGGAAAAYVLSTGIQSLASSALATVNISDTDAIFVSNVAGTNGITANGRDLFLTSGTTASIIFNAPVNLGDGRIILNSSGGASQGAAGTIVCGNLLLQGNGVFDLSNAGNNLINVSASSGAGSVTISDVDSLFVTTVFGIPGITRAGSVTLVAGGTLTINSNVTSTAGTVLLQSGASGTGNLVFGPGGVGVQAPGMALVAGDSTGGAGTTAFVDTVTNAPFFRGSAGGATNPVSFTLRQDLAMGDAALPALARFGAGNVTNLNYTLQIMDGGLTISTSAKVASANLVTFSSTLTQINGVLALASLAANGTTRLNVGALSATGSLVFNGNLNLQLDTTLTGTGVTLGGNVDDGATPRNLIVNASGITLFAGGVDLNSVTTNGAGTTQISAAMTTLGAMTFNDPVAFIGNSTLSTPGTVTFLSSVSVGVQTVTLLAGEIDFLGGAGSVSGTSILTLAQNVGSTPISVFGTGTSPTSLDLTNSDMAALANGFSEVHVGRLNGAGPIGIHGGGVTDPFFFDAGGAGSSISVDTGSLIGTGNASFSFAASSITFGALVRTAGGTITANGAALLTTGLSFDTTGGGLVPAGADVTFTSTLDGAVSGAQALTTTVGSTGRASFLGAVGGTTSLSGFTVAGAAQISGGLVRTANAQNYNGPVVLGGAATTQFQGTLLSFNGSVDATGAGQQGLLALAPTGFAGPVGNTTPLGFLTVNGSGLFTSNVTVTNAGGLSGNISVAGATTLSGSQDNVLTFAAPTGSVTLGGGVAASNAGEQGLNVTGNLVLGGALAGAVPLRQLSVTGTTLVNTAGLVNTSAIGGGTGHQTYTGAVTVSAGVTFQALGGGEVTFGSTLAAGVNDVTVRARGFFPNGTVTGTGNLAIEPAAANGNMLIGAGDGAGGVLDLPAATLTRLQNGFTSITFGRADGSGTLTIAGAYTAQDSTVFKAPVAPGRIEVNAPLTASGNGSFTFIGSGSTTVLNADVRTAGQGIVFNDAVLIASALITVDTTNNGAVPTGANITFLFGVNSETGENNALTVRSGTLGTTTFTGNVGTALGGGLSSLTTDAGGVTRIGASVTATTQSYGDALLLDGNATLTGNAFTFASTINASTAGFSLSLISASAGALALFQGSIGVTTPLGSLSTSAQVTSRFSASPVRTSGLQSYSGPVELLTSMTFTGGSVAFLGGIVGNGNALIVNSPGSTTFAGVVAGLTTLTTDAPGVTFVNGPTLTATSNITFADAVQIGPATVTSLTGVLTFGSTLDGQENDFVLSGAEINFFGQVRGTGHVRLLQSGPTQNYNLAHSTEGGGDALDITAGELDLFQAGFADLEFGADDGGAIMNVEAYTFNASIQINMPATGGQIQVLGTIACDADNGTIGVRGNGSTTHLFGDVITRGGAITIDDSVILEAATVNLDTTAGNHPGGANVTIKKRINSTTNLAHSLRIFAGLGVARFDGEVGGLAGGLPGFLDVRAAGGTLLNGPSFRTIGAQTFNGPLTLGPTVFLQTQGAPITVTGGVDGQSNLTIGAGTGAVSFGGSVGGLTTLSSLTINSGATRVFAGAVNVQVLTVFGGSVQFNGLTNINTGLLISGTLGGSGDIFVDLPFTWVGGDMIGSGRTTIRQSGALVLSGGPKTLSRTIENRGTVYWTDGGLNFVGGTFINASAGQFFAQSAGAFVGVSGVNAFQNQGTFERSGTGSGGLTNLNVTNTGTIRILSGDLAITPAGPAFTLVNAGLISVGANSKLNVIGNLILGANSVVAFELGGNQTGQFGQIVATGTVTLGGTLAVTLVNGFTPHSGDRFPLILGSSVNGTFGTLSLPDISPLQFQTQYNPADFTLIIPGGIDFNGDGVVDADDLGDFITAFFDPNHTLQVDFNGDGEINPDDLGDFITAYFGR